MSGPSRVNVPHMGTAAIPVVVRPPVGRQRSSSIRIRRTPSSTAIPTTTALATVGENGLLDGTFSSPGRRRSTSEPQRPRSGSFTNESTAQISAGVGLSRVVEESVTPPEARVATIQHALNDVRPPSETGSTVRLGAGSRMRQGLRRNWSRMSVDPTTPSLEDYDSHMIDFLDLVDPEVSALNTLNDIQNSLFVPDLGWLLNRQPTYQLSRRPTTVDKKDEYETIDEHVTETAAGGARITGTLGRTLHMDDDERLVARTDSRASRTQSINSELSKNRFAVLPHGASLEGWTQEDKDELDDHVRHLLHSRKEKFRRSMKGFGQYVRKPLGFLVTLYAFLITTFGLLWVLFLIGWISGGDRHSYDVNVIDNVLVALFAVIGDGLAPFRCIDTYHMGFIAYYHRLTWKLRDKNALPKLPDRNDLPMVEVDKDLEAASPTSVDLVLTPKQQKRFLHHQGKYSKSHTFYRPHETETHHAFPLHYMMAVTILLDCHSAFQIALGTCTWSISYHIRPQALTATILSCSIACNITAGVLISRGNKITRKKEVIERIFRQALTEEAMKKVEARRIRAEETTF